MALSESQILIVLVFILVAVIIALAIRLELRLNRLLKGTDKKSLESGIINLKEAEKEFSVFKTHTEETLKQLKTKLRKSIRHVDTIRFDPFKGESSGGNQSFATAFLDEDGDGVVISTVHTRERVGIFSKPIKSGNSEYELTLEEQAVIKQAQKK